MALPLALGALAVIPFLMGVPPLRRGIAHSTNFLIPNELPDQFILPEMRWRGLIEEEDYKKFMRRLGFNDDRADKIFNVVQNLLTPLEVITAKRRGLIDEDTFNQLMKRNRVTQETSKRLEEVSEFRPQAQDLIRFAVREIFTPDIRQLFKLDSEFPVEILPRAKEIGMREVDVKDFWAAHWQLPPISAATEMVHRLNPEFEKEDPVTVEDFKTLLRAQDVMPFWRERLRKILFTMPTRVDIRRMLRDGHISDTKALQLYRQLGYNPENANLMTELARSFYKSGDRDLTRALITKAFKLKEIERGQAIELLTGIGFGENDANLIITLDETTEKDRLLDDQVDTAQDAFVKGVITESEFSSQIDSLNLPAARKDLMFTDALVRRVKKKVIPPKEDIKAFFQRQIITQQEAESLLFETGVRQIDILKYITLWTAPA